MNENEGFILHCKATKALSGDITNGFITSVTQREVFPSRSTCIGF